MSNYNLSASERARAFPIHIELGMAESGMNSPATPMRDDTGKHGKPKKHYPVVYIDGVKGLEKLPKSGCMLVEFRRRRLSLEENADGKETTGVSLELHTICLQGEQDEGGSLEDVMRRAGDKSSKADEDDETEEEE